MLHLHGCDHSHDGIRYECAPIPEYCICYMVAISYRLVRLQNYIMFKDGLRGALADCVIIRCTLRQYIFLDSLEERQLRFDVLVKTCSCTCEHELEQYLCLYSTLLKPEVILLNCTRKLVVLTCAITSFVIVSSTYGIVNRVPSSDCHSNMLKSFESF